MGFKRTLATLVIAGAASLGLAEKVKADNWTVLDNPWESGTAAYNISNNKVVGCYGSGLARSFSYDLSNPNPSPAGWNKIELEGIPTDTLIQINSIDNNRTVGRYSDSSGTHGFIYENAEWTRVDRPEASATQLSDADGPNFVGMNLFQDNNWHGFAYNGIDWNSIDKPGANSTQPYSISGNKIVGVYNSDFSFLYDGTTWTDINVPGATNTLACAIDGNNIGGFYYSSDGKMHGFFHQDGTNQWKTIDAPGAG